MKKPPRNVALCQNNAMGFTIYDHSNQKYLIKTVRSGGEPTFSQTGLPQTFATFDEGTACLTSMSLRFPSKHKPEMEVVNVYMLFLSKKLYLGDKLEIPMEGIDIVHEWLRRIELLTPLEKSSMGQLTQRTQLDLQLAEYLRGLLAPKESE